MGNQQLSTFEDRVEFLALEARFGDGSLWKHPECRNSKIVYTSTSQELLEAKRLICPELFATGVKFFETKNAKGRFANARPMYRLASVVHPIISNVKELTSEDLINRLTLDILGLWYLDDGCTIRRTDTKGECYRFMLCVGALIPTKELESLFISRVQDIFDMASIGRVMINGTKGTERNKIWIIPHSIARLILQQAVKYKALSYKCPASFLLGKSSETIRKE